MSKKKKKNQTVIRSLIYNLCGVLRLTSAGQRRQISQWPFYNWVFSSQCILKYTQFTQTFCMCLFFRSFQLHSQAFRGLQCLAGAQKWDRESSPGRGCCSADTHDRGSDGMREGGREEERIFTSSTVILTYSCNQFKPVVFSLPLSQLTPADGSSLSDYSSEPALYFWSNGPIRRPDPSPACTCTLPHL